MEGGGAASSKAAPDVDLRSRGLPTDLIVSVAGVVVCGAFLVGRYRGDQPDGADERGVLWPLVELVLWGLWRLFQLIFALAVLLVLTLVVRQRSLIYAPVPPGAQRSPRDNPPQFRSPERWGLPFEDVKIVTEDGVKLHAWLVYQPEDVCEELGVPYTLVYFHGNAGNIGHRLENVADMHEKLKINILIVDYRGYGDSEDGPGPSESGFMLDALATYLWIVRRAGAPVKAGARPRVASDRLLLFGRSIGGCVAGGLAKAVLETQSSGNPLPMPAGLVLENSLTSIREMAVQLFPFLRCLRPLIRWPILLDEWRAEERLEFVARRHRDWGCCLLSGLRDELVPPAHMRRLYEVLERGRPRVLEMHTFEEGGHNDTPARGGDAYWEAFAGFLARLSEAAGEAEAPPADKDR